MCCQEESQDSQITVTLDTSLTNTDELSLGRINLLCFIVNEYMTFGSFPGKDQGRFHHEGKVVMMIKLVFASLMIDIPITLSALAEPDWLGAAQAGGNGDENGKHASIDQGGN